MVNVTKLNEKTAQNVPKKAMMNLSQETLDLFEHAYKSQSSPKVVEAVLKKMLEDRGEKW